MSSFCSEEKSIPCQVAEAGVDGEDRGDGDEDGTAVEPERGEDREPPVEPFAAGELEEEEDDRGDLPGGLVFSQLLGR